MIGLDTNLLLRLGDDRDPVQKARASALVRAQGQGGSYVNPIVLSEFAWTLRSRYKLTREQIAARVSIVLEAPEFIVAEAPEAARALERFRIGPADFADYFLAEMNRSAGCAHTSTFDIAALKSGEPFSALRTLT
ncbi:MAG TPA: PIN domain-containing protein [Roseiarcus sp.]|jgi:predicted nucleic-acid-binding protein